MTQPLTRSNRLWTTAAIVAAALLVLGGLIIVQVTTGGDPSEAEPADTASVVERADSHVLDDPSDPRATLVEFLDFECEACGAAYPFIEQLRQQYRDDLKLVIRYFPLDGHLNSRNAAHAVEAAARQGELEAMYSMMFQTQAQWGDQRVDHSDLFRGFAEDIGVDMAQYDRDVASDDVAARVERDYRDGRTVGVSGTPSFFLDGERMEITSTQDFIDQIEQAIQ